MPKITINGTEYEVPPLTLKSLYGGGMELIREADKIINETSDIWGAMKPRGELVVLALKQAWPELADDDIMSALNTKNVTPIWLDVLGISGMGQSALGEAKIPAPEVPATE